LHEGNPVREPPSSEPLSEEMASTQAQDAAGAGVGSVADQTPLVDTASVHTTNTVTSQLSAVEVDDNEVSTCISSRLQIDLGGAIYGFIYLFRSR
jgi:hypothetical protein